MKNIIRIAGVLIIILLIQSCKKKEVPTLTTSAITSITGISAISGGTITDEGSGTIIARGVCWNTTITTTIADNKTSDGTGEGTFTSDMSGLSGGTTYYVRAYATNSAGTGYGMLMSFATLGQTPTAITQPASNITTTGAALNGIVNANYLSTNVTFEYGINTNYGQNVTITQNPIIGNSSTAIDANISGLLPGTLYHFRIKTVNSLGTVPGDDMFFTTLGQIPSATTQSATNITTTTATFNATINANSLSTTVSFEYGTTTNYGNSAVIPQNPVSGNTNASVSANITGLLVETTYYFRVKTVNYLGTTYGNDMSFNTSAQTLLTLPLTNVDIVQWNSIDAVSTSGAYLSAASSGNSIIVMYKGERITGSSVISQIQVHNKTMTNIERIDFYIWRLNKLGSYDKIYQENITSKISDGNGVKTVTLASATNVVEGDFVGMMWDGQDVNVDINAATAAAANSIRYKSTTTPYDPMAWDSESGIAYKTQIHCLGTAPLIIGIGDSMMESYPLHTSMVDVNRTTVDVTKSWLYKLYSTDNRFIYQDCGIGAEETRAIEARFNRDIVLKTPRFAVINGGVNDIANGTAKSTFLTKWKSMLDMCLAAGIVPIVWKIMPWKNGTNVQMQTRDEWNADLVTLFNTYAIDGKIIIDWDTDVGVNRVGGDSGNLWNINPTYAQGDGVHLNEGGQAKIAEVMLREIGKVFAL